MNSGGTSSRDFFTSSRKRLSSSGGSSSAPRASDVWGSESFCRQPFQQIDRLIVSCQRAVELARLALGLSHEVQALRKHQMIDR